MTSKHSLCYFAVLSALALSCNVEKEYKQSEGAREINQISAFFPESECKTVLADDERSILWNPNEEINVFYNNVGVKFTSLNTQPVDQTIFVGAQPVIFGGTEGYDKKYIYGVYPYSDSNAQTDDGITLTVPAVQKAVKSSFADGAFPSVGRSKNSEIAFYNVCGGIRFSVTNSNVMRVLIWGNDDEMLAGRVNLQFDENGKPLVSEILEGEKMLTLTAPSDKGFEVGEWYYASILPVTFSKGVRFDLFLSPDDYSVKHGGKSIDSCKEIKRSVFGSLPEIDKGIQFDDNFIMVADSEYNVGAGGDNVVMYFGYSIDFEIEIDKPEWISRVMTKSLIVEDLVFAVAENKDSQARTGHVIFTSKDKTQKQIVTITQAGADPGQPDFKLDVSTLIFREQDGPKTVNVTSDRAWTITHKPYWVDVSQSSGDQTKSTQAIEVSVNEVTDTDRFDTITFSEVTSDYQFIHLANLLVIQKAGEKCLYFNDFDKESAQMFGSEWPRLSDTECWKNETGSGISSLKYLTVGNKASVRNTSCSFGSGVNNIFFSYDSRFGVKNITLGESVNYTLSFFGTRKQYSGGSSVFDHDAFKVYVSEDGKKWVQVDYTFDGGDPDGVWGQASTTFTVPAGTKTLCIGIPQPGETSTYRIDDLKLIESEISGTVLDFSKGMEIEELNDKKTEDPAKAEMKTVAEFISLADKDTYYKLKGKISSFNSNAFSFNLTDETGTIYVRNVTLASKQAYSEGLKNGNVVTISAKYDYYEPASRHEVDEVVILDYKVVEHSLIVTDRVSDVLAAAVGDTIVLNNALVVAAAKAAYVVTDSAGEDYVVVYQQAEGKDTAVDVGDIVCVTSVMGIYYSMPQLNGPVTKVVSKDNPVQWPEPEDITSNFDSWSSKKIKYISFTGTLSASGKYYNVTVPGASSKMGSIQPAYGLDELLNLPGTTFEGYYLYTTGAKYIYIMYTQTGSGIK